MVALPDPASPTRDAIYDLYKRRHAENKPRPYLGLSIVGQECARKSWLAFRWCGQESKPGRIERLLETGHLEEARVKDNLRALGYQIEGEQHEVSAANGHVMGHLDGVVLGVLEAPKTWHLLEIKTANDRNFKLLLKSGVEVAKPEHYAQMQGYMGAEKLTRALYVAVNKNTDEIYVERVKFDKEKFAALMARAEMVVRSPVPLTKISEKGDTYPCKFCWAVDQCHNGAVSDVNCRTCVHSSLGSSPGVWVCERHEEIIGEDMQRTGCNDHLLIPDLITWAEPVEATRDWIRYRHRETGAEFINVAGVGFPGSDVPAHSSRGIRAAQAAGLTNKTVAMARDILGGEIVG